MDYQKETHNSVVSMYQEKAKECERVKEELKNERNYSRQLEDMLEIYKSLAIHGAIYVNTYSQDCDGVESMSSNVFKTAEDYYDAHKSFCDSVEGSCSWQIVDPQDARPQEECGTFGQGWGIK